MIARCTNPNHHAWKNYGGRGITVCERWLDLATYLADVGFPPGPGMTLDRIDNDGNYEPGNVRWATYSEQNMNQRHANRLRTECDRGHPFTPENTRARNDGGRVCRTCVRENTRKYRAQRAEMANA
jgi:hypothetical protein